MATPNTPILLSKKSQEGIVQYLRTCTAFQSNNWNIREHLRKVDLSYMREEDQTADHQTSKALNRLGDSSRFQNITVPVVMPAVEAAVTYQASVFLTGHPIFGIASNPANMDAAMQMETLIEEQSTRGGWVRELMLFFRDGFKYNLAACEVTWDKYIVPTFETDLSFSTTQARPKEIAWEGNCLKRLDPYNLIFDNRVAPTEMYYKGEFAGYTELKSRIALKTFIESLPDKMIDNIVPAFESGMGFQGTSALNPLSSYYTPELNPNALLQTKQANGVNWLSWASLSGAENKINYRDMYEVTTLYARILPSDFNIKVPAKNTPQVWKFIFVNNSVLIYAERQTNAHGYLPVLFSQPLEDGLTYQTKSLADNVLPIQDITSAMWNSIIAARRRAISDRGIYDPSRISEAHINSANPAAKIPVRPAAYGKPVAEAYYPIPFRDDQSGLIMQETQPLLQMANMIAGQNQARQGQFVKGNKTLHEFNTVMANANGRDQMCSMLLEAQFFTPLKDILRYNILQYQGGVSLYSRNQDQVVQIDPLTLRKTILEFKISDGLTPTDKLVNTDALQVAMQVLGSSPQLAAGYNVAPLFSYLIKLQGGHIQAFEKSSQQVAYEQAMAAWQQQVQMIAESLKGQDAETAQKLMKQMPPQPQPQQYGYNPQQQGAAPGQPEKQTEVATRINNIVNNISNNEGE